MKLSVPNARLPQERQRFRNVRRVITMTTPHTHLVFLETSGNQAYIYATNRLRENVGASELTARAAMHWLCEALGRGDLNPARPAEFRSRLKANPTCATGEEIVLATSGKAMVLAPNRARAEALIQALTTRALQDAPGMSLHGAVVELSGRDPKAARQAVVDAHHRFDAHRRLLSASLTRDPLLPFVEPCTSSGAPAAVLRDGEALGVTALAKRTHAEHWYDRVNAILRPHGLSQIYAIDKMERRFKSLDWLGLLYSDGNGLGQIMLSFDQWLPANLDYFEALRTFSLALDEATELAFLDAARLLHALLGDRDRKSEELPLVPLLLGGDDLSVLVHGRYVLPFARAFLDAFERHTSAAPSIAVIAERALGAGRLSAAAGVAIIKPHYPFHAAHGLAEGLLRSAKAVKKHVQRDGQPFPCSALDFHVLFDAAHAELGTVREQRRRAADGARLWGGPYVTTPLDALSAAEGQDWIQRQHVDGLVRRIGIFNAREDGRLRFPASHAHALREALAGGRAQADAALRSRGWLYDRGLSALLETSATDTTGASLFRLDAEGRAVDTRYLDALTAAEFWPPIQAEEEAVP